MPRTRPAKPELRTLDDRLLPNATAALLAPWAFSLALPPTVTSTFDEATGTLTVNGSNEADTIRLLEADGDVTVEASRPINVYAPGTTRVAAALVKTVVVNGLGGDDTLSIRDLRGTYDQFNSNTSSTYATKRSVTVNGGGGRDTLNGGAADATLNGDAGDDSLNAGTGAERLNGGTGRNSYFGIGPADAATDPFLTPRVQALWLVRGTLNAAALEAMSRTPDGSLGRTGMLAVLEAARLQPNGIDGGTYRDLQQLVNTGRGAGLSDGDSYLLNRVLTQAGKPPEAGGSLNYAIAFRLAVDHWLKGTTLPKLTSDATGWLQTATPLFGSTGGPRPEDIKQGLLGDCTLLAPLASMAANRPDLIRDMVRENSDGTFTVRFRNVDAKRWEYVTVDRRFPTARGNWAYTNPAATGAVWPAVVEKAYAQWKGAPGNKPSFDVELPGGVGFNGFYATASGVGVGDYETLQRSYNLKVSVLGNTLHQSAQKGGNTITTTMELGGDVRGFAFGFYDEDTDDWFLRMVNPSGTSYDAVRAGVRNGIAAFRSGNSVTMGTDWNPHPDAGFLSEHAYAMIGYNPDTQQARIYNPHGYDHWMTVEQMVKTFRVVQW